MKKSLVLFLCRALCAALVLSLCACTSPKDEKLIPLPDLSSSQPSEQNSSDTTTPDPTTASGPETPTASENPTESEVPTETTALPPDTPSSDTTTASEKPTEPSGVTHKTTIYIDPGHGFLSPSGKAMDSGVTETVYTKLAAEQGQKLYEADLNLFVSLKLKALLQNAGYDVIMSRESYVNEPMPLSTRAQRVRESTADVFISLHSNSAASESARGCRILCCDSSKRSDAAACQAFARSVADAVDAAGASGKTVTIHDGNSLAMCNSTTTTPAILVEMCFLTNEADARSALTEEWQNLMALALFNGITKQFPLEYSFV